MEIDGYRRLACAVIAKGIEHYTGRQLTFVGLGKERGTTSFEHDDARRFLESTRLEFWCHIAEMEAEAIRERVLIPRVPKSV